MKPQHAGFALALLALLGSQAAAQTQNDPARPRAYEPIAPRALPAPGLLTAQVKDPKLPDIKDKDKEPAPAPMTDIFAQAPTAGGGEAPSGINPRMIGDFPGYFSLRTVTVPSVQTVTVYQPQFRTVNGVVVGTQLVPISTTQVPVNVTTTTRILNPGHGMFKVAENQSPAPEDRAYFTYNYYNGIRGPENGVPGPRTDTQTVIVNGLPTTITTANPGVPPPRVDLHNETFGFEKTLLGGNASVGLRVPIFQMQGDGSIGQNDFGDLTVFLKYALINDRDTGNVVCAGVGITAPTGPAFETIAGTFHSTLLQPFGGARLNFDRCYVQGFSSVVIPTDQRDVTTLFNDIGVGYWLQRGGPGQLLTGIIPTVEAHVATPLNHRATTDPMYCPDLLTITSGVHLGLGNRSMLTIGVATPVTGPRVFDVEAIVQFNFRF